MQWRGKGITVTLLHSRAGLATQVLIQTLEATLLFDAGDGTLRDLIRTGVPHQDLTGVYFTHGHADHVAGLYALLGFLRSEGHELPVRIWYPEGSREIECILGAFRDAHWDSLPYLVEAHPLADHQAVRIGEVEVFARRVEHWHSIRGELLSPAPALGYRITFRDETVAISGDTAPCPALVDIVRDADLALIEATLGDEAPLDQRTHLHLTTKAAHDLARLARRAWFIHTAVGTPETPGPCAVRQPDV